MLRNRVIKAATFEGVMPANLLPFRSDLSIDEPAYRGHLRWLAGVRGVTGPLLIAANRPGVQPFMLGQTKGQQGAKRVQEALSRYLSRLNVPPQTFAPQAVFEALHNAPQENP